MARLGNIYWIDRPGISALESRLADKYVLLLDRIYRYRRARNFTLSCAAGDAADVVAARLANLRSETAGGMAISNNPPPFEAMSLHIEDLFALVSDTTAGAEVATEEQDAALDSLMDEMRTARKDADKERAAEKKPHDDAAKAVQARWKPLLDRCDAGVAEIKKLLTPYREAKQRAKDEAARQAREEAEQRQREAQEALRSSDDLESRFAAEEQLKQASKLTAVANKIDRSATGLRTHWEAEITDRRAALNFYIKRNPDDFAALIQELADRDARSNRPAVPGVVYHERKKAA